MFLEEGCFWKKDVFSWCYKSLWPFFFWHGKPMRTSENLPMDAAKKSASLTNCCTSKQQAENIFLFSSIFADLMSVFFRWVETTN